MTGPVSKPLAPAIKWRLHLRASPNVVYDLLATDEGRARFWCESAQERDGIVHFKFPDRHQCEGRVLHKEPGRRFDVTYFDGSHVSFLLTDDEHGGTDLTVTERDLPQKNVGEHRAGWVAVLLGLKAAVDFGIDLRNHDAMRTWEAGYCDA